MVDLTSLLSCIISTIFHNFLAQGLHTIIVFREHHFLAFKGLTGTTTIRIFSLVVIFELQMYLSEMLSLPDNRMALFTCEKLIVRSLL